MVEFHGASSSSPSRLLPATVEVAVYSACRGESNGELIYMMTSSKCAQDIAERKTKYTGGDGETSCEKRIQKVFLHSMGYETTVVEIARDAPYPQLHL